MALSRQQLVELNVDLRRWREELRDEVQLRNELLAQLRDSDGTCLYESAARMRGLEQQSLADTVARFNRKQMERLSDELEAVEEALNRMALDEYGTCTDCGLGIAIERLRAEPTTRLCAACQSTRERRLQSETYEPTQ
jgi:RNA polymerase-binding transcription factor DksA